MEIWWQRNLGKRYMDRPVWMGKMCEDICSMGMFNEWWLQQRMILMIRWIGWPILKSTTLSPNMHHSPGWSAGHQWQVDYIRLLPSWEEQCFVLTGIDTLDADLPSLYAMLLRILSPVGLQNPPSWHPTEQCFWPSNSFTRRRNGAVGPHSRNSPVFITFPTILKQSAWWNIGMAFWILSYTASLVTIPVGLGKDSLEGSRSWLSIQNMVLFLWEPGFTYPGIKGGNGRGTIHHYS